MVARRYDGEQLQHALGGEGAFDVVSGSWSLEAIAVELCIASASGDRHNNTVGLSVRLGGGLFPSGWYFTVAG